MRYLVSLILALALGVMGCSETSGTAGGGGTAGVGGDGGVGGEGGSGGIDDNPYVSKDLWLCRPDIENDHCDTADLSMTEIQPDGTMVVLDEVATNPDAQVDCFYVYPTVNDSTEPGNIEDLVPHPQEEIEIVSRQAARFRGLCRVFAPLYRQMYVITYTEHRYAWEDTEFFQKAYGDVVEAFEQYMRVHNDGRDFVLIGLSQGSHILTRLLEDKFDQDEALREQLVAAVLTGPSNRIQVLEGEVVGGSFENVPLCTIVGQTGCVIAFDANPAGIDTTYATTALSFPPSARACANPASLDDGQATLGALAFERSHWVLGDVFPDGVDTQWVRYPGIYTSRCAAADERHVLLVDVAGDYLGEVPITPQEIQQMYVAAGSVRNLHGVEDYLSYTDLLRIVEQQIASRAN